MCCPSVSAFALRPTEAHGGVDLPVEDSSTPRGLRPRRAKARERLPSYCKPASSHPQAACCEDRSDPPNTPAPFRLLSIRAPASGGATDFFLASALFGHRPTLRSTGEEDARCVQPTSATRTTCVHPHLAHSRLARAGCPAGRPHGVLGSVRPLSHRGSGRFTTSETASADRHFGRTVRPAPHGLESEAWAFSSHEPRAIEPLTPLSRSAFTVTPLRASPKLPCLAARLSFGEVGAGRTMRVPPRSPSTSCRETRRLG